MILFRKPHTLLRYSCMQNETLTKKGVFNGGQHIQIEEIDSEVKQTWVDLRNYYRNYQH